VFLDMDGVMNNQLAYARSIETPPIHPPENPSYLTVDPACVIRLKQWVERNDADVVLSTSWRSPHIDDGGWLNENGQNSHSQMNNRDIWIALQWGGWTDVARLIGNTPRIYNLIRGEEINFWLKQHPARFKKGVTPYLILDDSDDMTASQKKKHFVRTVEDDGLTEADITRMDEMLRQQTLMRNTTP
jgi:HAD domain in Swiss Army Knife RNA repair proteins